MFPEPAAGDRQFKVGHVFRWTAPFLEQKRAVGFLDMDAAVLDGLSRIGLQQLAGGFSRDQRKWRISSLFVPFAFRRAAASGP